MFGGLRKSAIRIHSDMYPNRWFKTISSGSGLCPVFISRSSVFYGIAMKSTNQALFSWIDVSKSPLSDAR